MKFTIFDNVGCATATELDMPWTEFCDKIKNPKIGRSKEEELIKLATFGTVRNPPQKRPNAPEETWSLKHDGNILEVTGIEAEHDLGTMPIDEANALLEKASIRALFYPSWNDGVHKPPKYNGGPRWRILAPLSKPVAPHLRAQLVARLNGVLGGILSGESFTTAQGYFFNKRPGTDFRVVCTFDDPENGTCIDELDELDFVAIGKGAEARKSKATGKAKGKKRITGSEMFAQAVEQLGRKLIDGDGRREMLKTFISALINKVNESDLWMMVKGIEAEYFDPGFPMDEENIQDIIKNRADKTAKERGTTDTIDPETGEIESALPFGSEQMLADRFTAQASGHFRWSPGMDWMTATPTHWERDSLLVRYNLAKHVCRSTAKGLDLKLAAKICAASTTNAVLSLARSAYSIATPVAAWDSYPMLLNTPGGVIDMETGKEVPRDGLLFTQLAGCAPAAMPTPCWDKFISEVFNGDVEMVEFIQRMGGYSLTGSIKEQKLFFLQGSGSNGKSVFLDVLRNLGGTYSHNLPSEALMTSRNEGHPTMFAALHGKRIAISSEIEESAHWAESRIKALTGDESLTARFMHKDFFTFNISHKHVIAGNFKPRLKGDDFAMVRRMVLVPFAQRFEGERRDNNLPDKLKAEYSGILAWFIEGARKWATSGLAMPAAVTEASREYMAEQNDLEMWLAECCEQGPRFSCAVSELYGSFSEWKQRNGEHAPSVKSFSQRLERTHNKVKTKQGMSFNGVRVASVFADSYGGRYASVSGR